MIQRLPGMIQGYSKFNCALNIKPQLRPFQNALVLQYTRSFITIKLRLDAYAYKSISPVNNVIAAFYVIIWQSNLIFNYLVLLHVPLTLLGI